MSVKPKPAAERARVRAAARQSLMVLLSEYYFTLS